MASGRSGLSEWERQQRSMAREAERERREAERARVAAEKEAQRVHRQSREAEVEKRNRDLEATAQRLATFLRAGLGRTAGFDLRADRIEVVIPPLDLGQDAVPITTPQWEPFAPRPPGALSRLFGGATRYGRDLVIAQASHEAAVREAEKQENARQQRVVAARRAYADRVKRAQDDARKQNAAIDELARAFSDRKSSAVEDYLRQVIRRVPLPKGFPHKADVAFNARAEQVVIRLELPPREVVPTVATYKYLSTKDEVRTTSRAKSDVSALYRTVISQVALLCVRDLFDSDPHLNAVGFNGHVHAINPATGEQEYPCIISLNVERTNFPPDANLKNVKPEDCVRRHLSAIVSNHPYELEPIEPILDFDMSKYSFVEGFDAVATLDSRPDLMDMSPSNFEHLVRQVFVAQGAEGWTTTDSNDDGVDAVIAKRTALMGGLSIIQAKRYSKVVGISHVRELAGAMEEKKAGWGILITTSWFTAKCWEKAREHSRMELIDGERLTYLIKEHLGKDVVIGIPNRPQPKGPR